MATYFFGIFITLLVYSPFAYILGGPRSLIKIIPDLGVVTMSVLMVFTSAFSTLLLRKKLLDVEPKRFLFGGMSSFVAVLGGSLGMQFLVVGSALHLIVLCIVYGCSVFAGIRLLK